MLKLCVPLCLVVTIVVTAAMSPLLGCCTIPAQTCVTMTRIDVQAGQYAVTAYDVCPVNTTNPRVSNSRLLLVTANASAAQALANATAGLFTQPEDTFGWKFEFWFFTSLVAVIESSFACLALALGLRYHYARATSIFRVQDDDDKASLMMPNGPSEVVQEPVAG